MVKNRGKRLFIIFLEIVYLVGEFFVLSMKERDKRTNYFDSGLRNVNMCTL